MRSAVGAVISLVGLVWLLLQPVGAVAQVITVGPDSTVVPTVPASAEEARSGFFLNRWDKPAKAAFFSAVVPGLGQAYNKAYWKVPIVLATGGVLGYFVIDNNSKYQDFRRALIQRTIDSTDTYINNPTYGLYNPTNGVFTQNGNRNLKSSRDFWRRNLEFTVLLSLGAYLLNVAEAYVHAHMKEFDVSDNLSLRVQPNMMQVPAMSATTMAPGLTFTLYTRTK